MDYTRSKSSVGIGNAVEEIQRKYEQLAHKVALLEQEIGFNKERLTDLEKEVIQQKSLNSAVARIIGRVLDVDVELNSSSNILTLVEFRDAIAWARKGQKDADLEGLVKWWKERKTEVETQTKNRWETIRLILAIFGSTIIGFVAHHFWPDK